VCNPHEASSQLVQLNHCCCSYKSLIFQKHLCFLNTKQHMLPVVRGMHVPNKWASIVLVNAPFNKYNQHLLLYRLMQKRWATVFTVCIIYDGKQAEGTVYSEPNRFQFGLFSGSVHVTCFISTCLSPYVHTGRGINIFKKEIHIIGCILLYRYFQDAFNRFIQYSQADNLWALIHKLAIQNLSSYPFNT